MSQSPRSIYPISYERDYARELKRRLRWVAEKLAEEFKAAESFRGDSEATRERAARRIFKQIRWEYESTYDDEADEELTEKVAERTERYVDEQATRQFRAVHGVDPLPTRRLKGLALTWSRENVSLITSLEEEYFARLEADIVVALRDGARYEQLAEVIQERYGTSARRAEIIARDQMGSLYSKVNEEKLKDVGVEEYRWRNSQDERVVGNPSGKYPEPSNPAMHGDHWAREGQVYSWSDGPEDGHPGEPIMCRCTAEPVWKFNGEEFEDPDDDSTG